MHTAVLLVSLLLASVAPLESEQLQRLQTARDGGDHREEAFAALLENVARWTPGTGDVAIRLDPDVDGLLVDPAERRGALCRVEGVVQQVATLDRPFDSVVEWFVRDDLGRPLVVYVPAEAAAGIEAGDPVRVDARFYKRMSIVARDGERRDYAAFVGGFPLRLRVASDTSVAPVVVVAVPVAIMLVIFAALFMYVRTHRRPRTRGSGVGVGRTAIVEDPGPLPDDPVEALAVLRQRAGDDGDDA